MSADRNCAGIDSRDTWRTCEGMGNRDARVSTGTSNHSQYAARAPAQARSGRRSASTRRMPTLDTIASPNSVRRISAAIFELLHQALELLDILLAEPALLAEMRDQRRDASVEQPVEKAAALG